MGSGDTVGRAERSGAEKLFDEGGEFGTMLAGGPLGFSRRDFLRLTGFGVVAASAAGCRRTPVRHALPYLVQPEDVVAGRPAYYASVCAGCSAGCGLVVKTRDGRPIKLEGNPGHELSRGGLCAAGQASILGLYDSHRLKRPTLGGREAEWGEVDGVIRTRLQEVRKEAKPTYFLSGPVISPTGRALLRKFLDSLPGARHVVLDGRFNSSLLAAYART